MRRDSNVIYHTSQAETSHYRCSALRGKNLSVTESEIFRKNLIAAREAAGMSAAGLSKAAKLNARAVTDIEEGRVKSPKLSTVVAIAAALDADPAEMCGLAPIAKIIPELTEFLGRYDEGDQERLLTALAAIAPRPESAA